MSQLNKTCKICHQTKPLNLFYRRKCSKDGFDSRCGVCMRKKGSTYFHSKHGEERMMMACEKYRKTAKGRISSNRYDAKYRINNLEKRYAHFLIRKEIKKDRIPKSSECLCHICKKQAHHYHHYKGYEHQHMLDVIPLCRQCHANAHRPSPPYVCFK